MCRHARFVRLIACCAFPALLAPMCGCSFIAKTVYLEAKGAQGKLHPAADLSPTVFADFNSLAFEPATTDTGERLAPRGLLKGFDEAAAKIAGHETYREFFHGGDPALRIQTTIYYFQEKGVFSGAEALGRVRLYDGEKLLLEGIVRSESEAFTAGGERALSAALVKGIFKFVAERKDPEKAKEIEKKMREREAEEEKREARSQK